MGGGFKAIVVAAGAIAVAAAGTLAASAAAGHHASPASASSPAMDRPAQLVVASAIPAKIRNYWLVNQVPPTTSVAVARFSSTSTYVWFGRLRTDPALGLVWCSVSYGGMYGTGEYCSLARTPAMGDTVGIQHVVTLTALTGNLSRTESVSMQQPGQHPSPGVIVSAAGFPFRVALASDTSATTATLVFRDAAGREIAHQARNENSAWPAQPARGGITVCRDHGGAVTAYRIGSGIGFWISDGSSMISSAPPADEPYLAANVAGSANGGLCGYAPADVARVAVQLADGKLEPSVPTIPGWPGSGLRFWGPLTLPSHVTDPVDILLIAYNSAGHVIARVPLWFAG
jgi:hypothetical protein